jgi:hypothetical protein
MSEEPNDYMERWATTEGLGIEPEEQEEPSLEVFSPAYRRAMKRTAMEWVREEEANEAR